MFAVAFCGSQVFCVPAGLLGGSSLLGGLEWCYGVGAVHDPGKKFLTVRSMLQEGIGWLLARALFHFVSVTLF